MANSEHGFTLEEIQGDLFSCPTSDSLAHCVSQDMAMGKGIAAKFKEQFGGVQNLKSQKRGVGQVAKLKISNRFVYYLITKERYNHKPTLASMEASLKYLRDEAINDNVRVISMPAIGCGLDRLQWEDVKKLIIETFKETSITVKVYKI